MKIIMITGLGGSGTRLYGHIIKSIGINLGKNINCSFDNLDMMYNLDYYKMIKNIFSFDDYYKFKKIFSEQINKSYENSQIFCIKEPNYHIFLHMVHRYCEEKNYKLNILHIIRDGLYIAKSKNKGQQRWLYLFPELKKYNNKYFQYLKYWYLCNLRCINLLKNLNIKHLILSYDNYDINQLKNILDFLNINIDINKIYIQKKEDTQVKLKIEDIPKEFINHLTEINSYIQY